MVEIWNKLDRDIRNKLRQDYNQDVYNDSYNEGYKKALENYFGKHNLISPIEPSPEQRFNVGDKVFAKNLNMVLEVIRIIPEYEKYELTGGSCWEWDSPLLEKYGE